MFLPLRPRILLLIPHLGGGGAEQVIALLARNLSREKYELHLGLITQSESDIGSADIPPRVHIHALGARRVRDGALKLLQLVRKIRPDVILSGMFHLNFLVLLLRPFFPPSTRVLIRQNGTVSAALASGNLPVYTRLLYRLLYRHADRVICQSTAMAADLVGQLGIRAERTAVLLNPVDIEAVRASARDNPPLGNSNKSTGPHLLAVGRLSPEKGIDLLLSALVAVREQFPFAGLTILGSGPEEARLKAQCRDLRLEAAIHFAGHVDHPSSYFREATVFVLSSRHEGMPNALLEAAACGIPIVALPASGGVSDLLRGHPGAWLASEISSPALAASLLTALEVLQPGERFMHSFIEDFRIDRALHAYEDLIDSVLLEARTDTRADAKTGAKIPHTDFKEYR